MTETEKQELARRAVASAAFMWCAGMLAACGQSAYLRLVVRGDRGWWCAPAMRRNGFEEYLLAKALPVLDDPGTLGCLLYLVREAWKWHAAREPGHRFPEVCIERVSGGYRSRVVSYGHDADGEDTVGTVRVGLVFDSEAEALVAALEAAPHD